MSDPAAPDQQPGTPPAQAQNSDTNAEHMIPKSRLDEVIKDRDALRAWKEQQEAAARSAADKAAAERGEWEKLANERAARVAELEQSTAADKKRADDYQAVLERQVKARVKALPEAAQKQLPEGDPLAQLAWLDALDAALNATQPPAPRGTNGGPNRGSTPAGNGANTDLIAEKRARIGAL